MLCAKFFSSSRLSLVTLLLLGFNLTPVHASPLAPGSVLSPAPLENGPVGATLLFSANNSFNAPFAFSGTLTTKIWTNDASSPFSTGLTFTYELTMDANPLAQPVSRFSISSYGGFLVDASYTNGTAGVGVAPLSIGRNPLGDVIRFTFEDVIGNPTLFQGTNSALLVLQTDAPYWQPTIAGVIDGSTANVNTFAPSVIPEPGPLELTTGGILFLFLFRRWATRRD